MATGSREVWAERVARWKASVLTAEEYARRHKLGTASLKWWKWKLGATKKTTISPLTFVEMTSAVKRESIEVVLEGGTVVRVPADFVEATLVRVLGVLEQRR